MFEIFAIVCFLNIQPSHHFCLKNAQVIGEYQTLEACDKAVNELVNYIDQPMKDRLTTIILRCEKTSIQL